MGEALVSIITVSNITFLPAFSTDSLTSLSYTVDSRDPGLFRGAIRPPLLDKDEAGSTSTGGCVRSVCVSELAGKSQASR